MKERIGKSVYEQSFESAWAELKIRHSYSRKGCRTIMLGIKSFHFVLKKEEVNLRKYKDAQAAYNTIFEYIESWYNCKPFIQV